MTAEVDMEKSTVTVRGTLEPQKLIEDIIKRLGKHVEMLKQEVETEKGKSNDNSNGKELEATNMYHYPPQYSLQHVYPSQIFSDENVFSCSTM